MSKRGHTMRQILASGAGFAMGGILSLSGCATGPIRTEPNRAFLDLAFADEPGRLALAYERKLDARAVCETIVSLVDDLAWLARWDSVLLKVACNSGKPHPAVTSPEAVRAMVGLFKDRGAGKVIVADQSGVEHVRLTKDGRRSSTREQMQKNGLLAAIEESGAELCGFDDRGWDGYFQPEADFENRWGDSLWLPRVLEEVDHVVYLPRFGSHAIAGYTCGIKIAVGWLRDDSRLALHREGEHFFERFAEVNHYRPLREKLRLVVTLGRKALLNIGPDVGSEYDFEGLVGLAARNLVDHDALAAAMLPWLDRDDTSFFDLYSPYPKRVNYWNEGFVEDMWGREAAAGYRDIVPPRLGRGLEYDACVSHLAALQGYRPRTIEVDVDRQQLPAGLLDFLRSEALFAI